MIMACPVKGGIFGHQKTGSPNGGHIRSFHFSDLIDSALKQGADAADAVVFDASSVSVSCRLGELRS